MTAAVRTVLATLVLAAVLAVSATAAAGASAPQLWYLDGALHSAAPANGVMEKGMGQQSGWVSVNAGSSETWLAENAAVCDVTFPGGSWVAELRIDPQILDISVEASGYDWQVSVGGWNTGSGWYEIATTTTSTTSWDEGRNVLIVELQTDPATIYEGDYLALRVTNKDGVPHTVITEGRSSLRSPDTDPGYPLPEVATAILLGVGLVGLLGFSRFKARQRPPH